MWFPGLTKSITRNSTGQGSSGNILSRKSREMTPGSFYLIINQTDLEIYLATGLAGFAVTVTWPLGVSVVPSNTPSLR